MSTRLKKEVDTGDFTLMLKDFVKAKEAKALKPHTLRLYESSGKTFYEFLVKEGHPTDVADITVDHFRDFFIARQKVVSANTVELEYRHIRPFFNWLVKEGEIPFAPTINLEVPEAREKTSDVIPVDHIARLVKACEGTSLIDRRDAAMIRLFAETGIRKGEMHSIRLEWLDLDAQSVKVRGKVARGAEEERTVFFGNNTADALRRYIRARRKSAFADCEWLWLADNRGRLGYKSIELIINKRCKLANLERINPHRFRHTFRHEWSMAGGQDGDLKTQGGWNNDKMLERYGKAAKLVRSKQAVDELRLGDRY